MPIRRSALTVISCLALASTAYAEAGAPQQPTKRVVRPSTNAALRRLQIPQAVVEPVMFPSQNRAIEHAKRTLVAAQTLVAEELARIPLHTIGFLTQRLVLGEPELANESALYITDASGKRDHIGYAMEMRLMPNSAENSAAGGRAWPTIGVLVSRTGRVMNPLFRGEKSIYSMGSHDIPRAVLERVSHADLAADHPLDHTGRVLARVQSRQFP